MESDWPLLSPTPSGGIPAPPPPDQAALVGRQRLSAPLSLSNPLMTTSQLRERQRSDAMQQAVSELSVLTEQLLELPARLKEASLAILRNHQYVEAVEAFADLAEAAWQGMATETIRMSSAARAIGSLP